ncbi:MAG TPA: glycosyltransferase family 39 protein [Anaerolineaceae bacterium]|nr:glycosyltransferase family 39 protein [Anaerolineaceae bacterium]
MSVKTAAVTPSIPAARSRVWAAWMAALLLVFAAGLAIRLFDLDDPPLDFHVPRQIHSALVARGMFAAEGGWISSGHPVRAIALGASEQWIEPPIIEWLVSRAYLLAGDADLRIPRLFSIGFWLLGGAALFWLARQFSSWAGALVALLYYLLLPYGVIASRSFQPDPLMVALTVAGLAALYRWRCAPGYGWAVAAGLVMGLAILVKQVVVFPLAGAAAGLVLGSLGWRGALRSRQVWLMAGLAVLPVVGYNVYGLWIAGFLGEQYGLRFFPGLLVDPAFYIRWAHQIEMTTGLAAALLGVVGSLLAPGNGRRGLLWGLWAGYLVYGLVFAYYTASHDYYHLPLIPLVALSLAPLAVHLVNGLPRWKPAWLAPVVLAGVLAVGSLYALYNTRAALKRNDYRAEPAVWYRLSQAMGFDGSKVIGVLDDYGARLMYWGYVTPAYWPSIGDVQLRELAGQDPEAVSFTERTAGRDFFVVTNFVDFEAQPELKRLLAERYPVFEQGDGYLIYDLRQPLEVE